MLILPVPTSLILVSLESILFINCTAEVQTLVKKKLIRPKQSMSSINFQKDPYLIIDICTVFIQSDEFIENEDFISLVDSQQGMQLLRKFIYDISDVPKAVLDQKMREVNKLAGPKLSLSIPSTADIKTLKKYEVLELSDTESSYEDNFNHFQAFKTWESVGGDLYKVTEYNESLECSISEEASDLASKLNDFSAKITSSITDKFPKFSIASLSVSDTSFQNAYDLFKKSYVDYAEPLEINNFNSREKTENEFSAKNFRESPLVGTTNFLTLSDSTLIKNTLESRGENCACPKCGIF